MLGSMFVNGADLAFILAVIVLNLIQIILG